MAIVLGLFDDIFTFHNKLVYLLQVCFSKLRQSFSWFRYFYFQAIFLTLKINMSSNVAFELMNQKDFFMSDYFKSNFRYFSQSDTLSLISSLLQVYSAVLVTKTGTVVGIITKADLLRIL
jgi:CBS domain-containing protein